LLVIDAVSETRLETVDDSPLKTSIIDSDNSLTCAGWRAENRGWNPSKTSVRLSAGVV